MQVGSLTVSNIRLAEMIGAKSEKPSGPFLLVKSKMGGYRYWAADKALLEEINSPKRKWQK